MMSHKIKEHSKETTKARQPGEKGNERIRTSSHLTSKKHVRKARYFYTTVKHLIRALYFLTVLHRVLYA